VNKKMTALILAATLGGCADVDMGGMNREEMLGTAAGAAVGGILGFQLGGGLLMNSSFAALGTIAGGATGFYATRALMGSDRAAYERTAQKGLEESSDGQVVDWQNPETGNSGIFRPIRSFRLADGRYCRQYRTTVSFDKTVRSGNGMACRNANGQWEVVSDDFS
jgi:surface antigen